MENAEKEIGGRADRHKAAVGRGAAGTGQEHCGCLHGSRDNRTCLRDELLKGEIFYTLREAQIVIESRRRHYNAIRPHASLGYQPPAPEVYMSAFTAWPASQHRTAPPTTLAHPPALNYHCAWTT